MSQVKQLDFRGTTIYCAADVHKKNWRINIQDREFELEDFSQDPDPAILLKHLQRRYPGAEYRICYEAGFTGFSAQRWFSSQGATCWVINAADVATNDKERRRKNDKIDARKLCEHFQSKKAKSVYIPDEQWEHGRSLVRARTSIVSNMTRCKNRIWQLLYFSGISLPKGYEADQYWSNRFVQLLQAINCKTEALRTTLDLYIRDYQQTKKLLLEATRAVRTLCKKSEYKNDIGFLRTIPGIGEINAAVILFELQDIFRFNSFDQLCSYAGLVPDTSDSGDTKREKGITDRRNNYLRTALIESSWIIKQRDPAMLMLYKKYCRKMDRNRAIVRIAKHLLARIYFVLKNKKEYVPCVVG